MPLFHFRQRVYCTYVLVLHTIQVCSQTAYYIPEPTPTDRPLLNYGCVLYNVTKLSVTDMIHLMLE